MDSWIDSENINPGERIYNAEAPAFLRNWAPFKFQPGRNEVAFVKKLADIIKTYRPGEEPRPEANRLGSDWRKRILRIEDTKKRLKGQQDPALAEER